MVFSTRSTFCNLKMGPILPKVKEVIASTQEEAKRHPRSCIRHNRQLLKYKDLKRLGM